MTLGSDFSGVNDVDFNLTFLEGTRPEQTAFMQAIARRLSTPRGGLFYDATYGLDMRAFLSDNIPPAIAQGVIASEVRKDERVEDCTVEIEVDKFGVWTINIDVRTSEASVYALTFKLDGSQLSLLNATVE